MYFFENFWFLKNFGSIPRWETYLVRFFFLIPLACALCVLLCAQVFFCCYFIWRSEINPYFYINWQPGLCKEEKDAIFNWWENSRSKLNYTDTTVHPVVSNGCAALCPWEELLRIRSMRMIESIATGYCLIKYVEYSLFWISARGKQETESNLAARDITNTTLDGRSPTLTVHQWRFFQIQTLVIDS